MTIAWILMAAGLTVGVAALVVLHLLPTGLSPGRNAVSQYGITRYRAGYRVQTLAYAVAGAGAAVGIAGLPGGHRLPVALCGLFAAARAAISWFPMDAPGAPATRTGQWHRFLAFLAFISIGLAAGFMSRQLGRTAADSGTAFLSGVLGLVMLAALVGMAADRRSGGRHFGFIERVFYLAVTIWLAVIAVRVAMGP